MSKKFEDARTFSDGSEIETELCIIGSGAAGITIAREFALTGIKTCLLEAGGMSIDPAVEDASDIRALGRNYAVSRTRLRYFGGTTNHWGGHCVPLEPHDFEAKPWIPHSGWPIGFADIEPHYRKAYGVLGLGDYDTTPEQISQEVGLPFIAWDNRVVRTQLSRYNRVRFGLAFGDALDAAENIRVILYADASELHMEDAGSRTVTSVTAHSPSGKSFRVRARRFVIAGGGIESARLLLMSNRDRPAGLGNQSDALGRYFMDHLWYPSGILTPSDVTNVPQLYSEEVRYRDIAVRAHLVLSPEASEASEIGRFRAEIRTLSHLHDSMRNLSHGSFSADDLIRVAGQPYMAGNTFACRENSPRDYLYLQNYIEQVPNPQSRVLLGPGRDAYGRPEAQLDWQLSAMDQKTVVQAHYAIATEAGATNFGRMRIDVPENPAVYLETAVGGAHHLGTTRMSARPQDGVVDQDCRVHGTNNLYVASSSVFPTGGYANPTLTIVALSLRLSEHIKKSYREK